MEYPLFQIIKDVEKETVGVTGVSNLSDGELTAVTFALLETARRNARVDNLLRLVANTRRSEEPKEIDSVRIIREDIDNIAGGIRTGGNESVKS